MLIFFTLSLVKILSCHFIPVRFLSEVAGDLWLLLIGIAGEMKLAEDYLPHPERLIL